jgi:hypothetical protein
LNPIQFILIGLLLGSFAIYFTRLRSQLLNRVVVSLILMVGIVFVLWPDASTVVAQAVGVGRGADLVLYLGLVGMIFVATVLFAKLRDVEDQLTALTRDIALENPSPPKEGSAEHG